MVHFVLTVSRSVVATGLSTGTNDNPTLCSGRLHHPTLFRPVRGLLAPGHQLIRFAGFCGDHLSNLQEHMVMEKMRAWKSASKGKQMKDFIKFFDEDLRCFSRDEQPKTDIPFEH